jgi:DNA segregation ATPase FtsK/SpoIIIE-like protein
MAQRRTAARSRPASKGKAARGGQKRPGPLKPALSGLARLARPRTASETLTLLSACLGVGTAGALELSGLIRGHQPGFELLWAAALLALAVGLRTSRWWQRALGGMTPGRIRTYVATVLLAAVAISFSWHLISSELGLGGSYPLLGPISRPPFALLALIVLVLVAVALLFRLPVHRWLASLVARSWDLAHKPGTRQVVDTTEVWNLPVIEPDPLPVEDPRPSAIAPEAGTMGENALSHDSPAAHRGNGPLLPPIDIFVPPPKGPVAPLDLEYKAQRIQETLASFKVAARVVAHHCGPVVTQFDIQPERGVKVRRITELSNDLALALAAPTIRIQAPVPGKPVVGIEIPNTSATMVTIRELFESEAYVSSESPLKVVLGKDVAGNPAVIDLTKMPHLLIAGATGSGKSVCINALISCLLYQNTPDKVRLMMVDPKMVELAVYNGVPHLLSPVVTQVDKVVGVLQWALREMERRYQLFAANTVRNIQRFNEKMETNNLTRLPYIVLIIDELADLMMVAPEDVEDAICRLAQLARAAGIHLVIATQRPSVDVVTGLIKANFPARIAFAMTSQVDSRTILDASGAEKLLGRGDMLYMPPDAPSRVRLQGAHVSDQEIERLVEFWHRSPLVAAVQRVAEEEFAEAEKAAAESKDELLDEAVRVVREYQHASVSLLQRRLRIGYARAARLMDQLEALKVVGPADGSKQRPVLDEVV